MLRDLKNPFQRSLSVAPQTTSGTTVITGSWVDLGSTDGPCVAEILNSAATGSPTAQAHAVKLQEADDNSGTGAADIADATATISADSQVTVIQAKNRSKRWVRIHVTPAWTGGSSPTTNVAGAVVAQKERY